MQKLIIDHLSRIERKLDRLDSRLDEAEKSYVKQEAAVIASMRRSDLLEKDHLELKEAVSPVIKVYTVGWGIGKITIGFSLVVGIIRGLASLKN